MVRAALVVLTSNRNVTERLNPRLVGSAEFKLRLKDAAMPLLRISKPPETVKPNRVVLPTFKFIVALADIDTSFVPAVKVNVPSRRKEPMLMNPVATTLA